MCIAPNTLPDGTLVSCHKCWQCRERAINDWVGRNIAESKTSKACHAVTLTYGRNSANDVQHERSVLLTYSDVQKYLKLLRRHGFPVRYFVTGEFGSKWGRAHWHVMLYWQDKVPPHELNDNFMEQHWPHGWSFWTQPTAHAVRYNCKYIQKDMGDNARQGHLAMSKKPPLGSLYFERLAELHVKQGIAPQTLEYSFPEVQRRNQHGKHEVVKFMLKDTPARLFLDHFVRKWRDVYPSRDLPRSRLVAEHVDPGSWVDYHADGRMIPGVPSEADRRRADDLAFEYREKQKRPASPWRDYDESDIERMYPTTDAYHEWAMSQASSKVPLEDWKGKPDGSQR